MKIIFLDFDGVLNGEDYFVKKHETEPPKDHWQEEDDFDPIAVNLLNQITDATGAKIVVSSSWRVGVEVQWLAELLERVGVTGEVIDKTRSFSDERRLEIERWLRDQTLESYVILDDEFDMGIHESHFIKTSGYTGLTQQDADKAIAILGRT